MIKGASVGVLQVLLRQCEDVRCKHLIQSDETSKLTSFSAWFFFFFLTLFVFNHLATSV